jgi:glutathione S-transferase
MELVLLIVVLALVEYIFFAVQVGKARVKYNIKAPAITGHPIFERRLRIQQNTVEQLVIFLPAIFAFAYMAESLDWAGNEIAAALGVIFLIGRAVYARAYARDPAARSMGFLLTFVPSAVMLAGTAIGILISIM